MMNVDNRDMDLGLSLGVSSQPVQTRWKNGSGAGVNAGSRVDHMAFVASDPLTELVWSPQNGLTLKCAGSGLADEKPSLQRYVEPNNIVCSPSLSIRACGITDKKSISEGNAGPSRAACHVDSEVAKSVGVAKPRGRSAGPFFGSSNGHTGTGGSFEESVKHSKDKDHCRDDEKNLMYSSNENGRNTDAAGEVGAGQADLLPLLTKESRPGMEETELFSGKFEVEGTGVGETEGIGKGCQRLGLDISLSSKTHTVEQFETPNVSFPNVPSQWRRNRELSVVVKESEDTMNMNRRTCSPDLCKLEATDENDIKYLTTNIACELSEERAEGVKSVPVEASSNDSRVCLYLRKGKMKEKYSSEREVDERISKDLDESQGSIVSCNSANSSSKGKRRWGFDNQFMFGSKRIKKQIHESPSSTSLVKQDSSFMNWISNMVKGLNQSNQEGRCLPSTTDFPNDELNGNDQKISMCNKTLDTGSKKMGFGSVFRSLYCPSMKVNETGTPTENYHVAGSRELILADESYANNATPTIDYTCNQSVSRNADGQSIQLKHKILNNLALTEAKDGVSSSDSSWGQKKSASARGNSSDPLAEGQPLKSMGNTSNAGGSLWIAKYSVKTPSPMSNLDHHNQKNLDGSKSLTDIVNVAGTDLQKCVPTESSICLKEGVIQKYRKTVRQKPLESLKSPEEMASLFARRLDALKHISSIAVRDDACNTRTKCSFCGKVGHKLQACSKITEIEMEGLLRYSSLYDGAEETPFLCIKCSQLDHWDSACPLSGEMQLGTGHKRCFSILKAKESQLNTDGSCNMSKCMVSTGCSLDMSRNPEVFPEKRILNLDGVQKCFALTTEDKKFKDKQLTPLCSIAVEPISEAPKGLYETVRRLRLSRTDILKWMNGHIPVSNLVGYFLRLRLGKWKEGLGGAGYYVACITGSPLERSSKRSKNLVCVSIGGIECVVESQYVSNHDFQEDELMMWWQNAKRSGGIPNEADLQFKLKEREKLRF